MLTYMVLGNWHAVYFYIQATLSALCESCVGTNSQPFLPSLNSHSQLFTLYITRAFLFLPFEVAHDVEFCVCSGPFTFTAIACKILVFSFLNSIKKWLVSVRKKRHLISDFFHQLVLLFAENFNSNKWTTRHICYLSNCSSYHVFILEYILFI